MAEEIKKALPATAAAEPRVMEVAEEIKDAPPAAEPRVMVVVVAATAAAAAAEEEDLISNLSDDILVSIVSGLPVRQLLRTAILSRRWRSLWTLTPRVDLCTERRPEAALGLLLLRNTCAHLNINFTPRTPIPVTNWIHRLTPTLKKLTLSITPANGALNDILAIPSLHELNLSDYGFPKTWKPPSGAVFSLRSLRIKHSYFFDHHLESLIRASPLLDRLFLFDILLLSHGLQIRSQLMTHLEIEFSDLASLQIDAPLLTTLMLNTLDQLQDHIVITTPSLLIFNVATTSTHNDGGKELCPNYNRIHRARYKSYNINIADIICKNNPSTQGASKPQMKPHQIDIFVGLRKLFLEMDLSYYNNALSLILVLGKCTNLKELGIDIPEFTNRSARLRKLLMGTEQNYDDNYISLVGCPSIPTEFQLANGIREDLHTVAPKYTFWRRDDSFACLEHHLQHFWIRGFAGLYTEVEFLKCILSKAALLKSLVISYNNYCPADTLKALKLIQPTSSDLHITTNFKACLDRQPSWIPYQ